MIENDLRPDSIREECEDSLRRLGVERIDLYQFHWPDWSTGTALEESWGTMAELVDEGKVRWIGVCNFDVEQLERCEAIRHVDSRAAAALAARARRARDRPAVGGASTGPGVIVYSPMGSGLLTGAFDRERIARARPGRLAARTRRSSPSRCSAATSRSSSGCVRSPSGSGRRCPRSRSRGRSRSPASPRAIVGARLPRHVDGWLPGADLELGERELREIDEAIADTGAGSDDPPTPAAAHAAREERAGVSVRDFLRSSGLPPDDLHELDAATFTACAD